MTGAPGGEEDLFGRCPTLLADPGSRAAGPDPEHWARCGEKCPLQRYSSNQEINADLRALATEFPHLASLVEVGGSGLGTELLGLRITAGADLPRPLLRPLVRYSGNMHGNEPVGRALLHHLAGRLVHAYGQDPELTELLDTTDITIIPTINPDGFDRATEGACSGGDYKVIENG